MKFSINQTQLYIEQNGSGPPILLIHGYPLNREMWRPQINSLSTSFNVIAPDLRGHGDSEPAASPYTMDLLADDCATVLKVLGIDQPVIVCGLSMGGYVSFAFYRKFPSLVAGLILAATRAGADATEAKLNRDKAAALAVEKGTYVVIEGMLPLILSPKTYEQRPELVREVENIMGETSLEGIVGALMGMKLRPDSTPDLGEIEVPVLIVHGADDQIIPLSEAESMHASLPDSTLKIIPDAGHLPNLEQPQLFNQTALQFLKKVYG
jgi:pimeloyl-ACP methyl ester carboxylesterase